VSLVLFQEDVMKRFNSLIAMIVAVLVASVGFADDQFEKGRAAVVVTKMTQKQKSKTTEVAPATQTQAPKASTAPAPSKSVAPSVSKDATCSSGSCSTMEASTSTYQYRRSSPFRRNREARESRGISIFGRSRSSGSCSSGGCS